MPDVPPSALLSRQRLILIAVVGSKSNFIKTVKIPVHWLQKHKKLEIDMRNAAQKHVFPHYEDQGLTLVMRENTDSAQALCSGTQLMRGALSREVRELARKVIQLQRIRGLNVSCRPL